MTQFGLFRRIWRKLVGLVRSADAAVFGISFRQHHRLLRDALRGAGDRRSILDIGCGIDSPVAPVVNEFSRSVGLDAHMASLVAAQASKDHDFHVLMDILCVDRVLAPASFDCVVLLDVIEHLSKEDGRRMLAAMERVARKRVIVFTPNGFVPQSAEPDNPWQLHVSGWSASEMRALGYRTIGVGGWKPLRWSYARPRWWPAPLWERIALLTESFFETRPDRAFQILCVKDIDRAETSQA